MDKKAKEAKNAYLRNWRKNNPDKVKKHNENYWIKAAQKTNDAK